MIIIKAIKFTYRKIAYYIFDKFLAHIFSAFGYYLFKKQYYLGIPEKEDLIYTTINSKLIRIDINEKECFDLLNNVILKYKKEFNSFPVNKVNDISEYYLLNGGFMAGDGNVYYSLIRHLKPNRIIEIGGGNSSKLASKAITMNSKNTEYIIIEPYPQKYLKDLNNIKELKVNKVQEVNLNLFETLNEGDILFIDSSHTLRLGGDVWYEYCEILPRLKSGVYIHIHDIALPRHYPKVYFDRHYFFNEQYVLQTFLTYNTKFKIVWPGGYLINKYPEKLRQAFLPEYDLMKDKFPNAEPSSFWLIVQ